MKKFICLVVVAVMGTVCAFGQDKQKGNFYITWGYHNDSYTRSTIHFKNTAPNDDDNYDFKITKAKARDQPDMHNLFQTPISVPQYVFNMGYFFRNKPEWGIEVSWDHLKYVVIDGQTFHLKGTFPNGVYHDVDTVLAPDFFHYEHTNGNNYLMVSAVRKFKFFEDTKVGTHLNILVKAGAGGLIPKTDSHIIGRHNDGPFRLSGLVIGASTAVRYSLFKYFYLEGSIKGAFADYTSVKLYQNGRAKQTFFSVQYIYSAGINIPI